jgi:hypothetical protein
MLPLSTHLFSHWSIPLICCIFSSALVLISRHVNINSKQKCLQAKPEDTLDLSRLLNDDLAAKVRTNPHRLVSTVMFYSLSILEKYKWNISSFRNYLEKFRVNLCQARTLANMTILLMSGWL